MNKHYVYRIYRTVEKLVHVIAKDEDEALDRAIRTANYIPVSDYDALDPFEIEFHEEGPISGALDDDSLFL